MKNYSIDEFKNGENVYHLSNSKLFMVAVEINKELNRITCNWVDLKGIKQTEIYTAVELGKQIDLEQGVKILRLFDRRNR